MARRVMAEGQQHRAIGLVGHRSSGKTTLAEMLLHAGGVVRKRGSVEEGTALLDFTAEERRRHMSMWPAYAWLPWEDMEIELVDTPGGNRGAHVRALALMGVDARVMVVSAVDGLERGAEQLLREARNVDVPLFIAVNKMDRPHPDHRALVEAISASSSCRVVQPVLPYFDDDGVFSGVIDVLADRVLRYDPEGSGQYSAEPVPSRLVREVSAARESLIEAAAMADESLLEHYLEYFELPVEDAWRGLRAAVLKGEVLPVVYTSAQQGVGAGPLLDVIYRLAPSPSEWVLPASDGPQPDYVAQYIGTSLDEELQPVAMLRVLWGRIPAHAVWTNSRTGETVRVRKAYRLRGPRRALAREVDAGAIIATWDPLPGLPGDAFTNGPRVPLTGPSTRPQMAWLHVEPIRPDQLEGLGDALKSVRRIDPSITWSEEEVGQGYRLAGTTQAQLQMAVGVIRGRFGIDVHTGLPPVAYRERIRSWVHDVHGLHSRMSGGEVAEYGECWIDAGPSGEDDPLVYRPDVDEDVLPRRFVPSIGVGAVRALEHGPTAGYPVRGVEVRCANGEYNALESEPEHFEHAGARALATALQIAGTEILEPWAEVLLYAPSAEVGVVLGDLSAHRGRVVGMEVDVDETSIQVHCPESELRTLGARLESLTGARAWFIARRSHYDVLPSNLEARVKSSSPFKDHIRAEAGHQERDLVAMDRRAG